MHLKQILNEAKERTTRAAVLQVTAGLEMSSGISEANVMSSTLLRGSKRLLCTRGRTGHAKGATQHVDHVFGYG